jgi:dGTPase
MEDQNTWSSLISYRRYGYQSGDESSRSAFTRDYDRIIFMSAFRRLQNKTQVFPLPGNVFVHNRLTHSLEVASVGRSLGNIVGQSLYDQVREEEAKDFYRFELGGVIASACLAHDLGNPAFGHSGEKAISSFFEENSGTIIGKKCLRDYYSDQEWLDLTHFEGNANALRLLTRQFQGKLSGGQTLMYVTLASIIKYPCASYEVDKGIVHRKKYGYFQSDKDAFEDIVNVFKLKKGNDIKRYPFVYLVEAADDICYRIIDLEDAHRIKIIQTNEIYDLFLSLLLELGDKIDRTKEVLSKIQDTNESVAFLRAKCINALTQKASHIFLEYKSSILRGNYNSSLMREVERDYTTLQDMERVSIDKIYYHRSVIEVELAGYNVMSELLKTFVSAVLETQRSSIQEKTIQLISQQYNQSNRNVSAYEKTMGVLDFVSGMTDGYATELYRKIKGIDIPSHQV